MYIDAFKRILFERLNCLKRMCVCQRQGSSFAMSKTAGKKLHWRSKVLDSFVPLLGSSGELGVSIGGGADYGEFPFVTLAPGGGLTVGDVILEIGGTPVLGMTLGDVRGVLNSCPHPIRIKTTAPGSSLCKDLRLYLSKCFTPGSVDSQLQQVIRENLYLRAVPCTTRQLRDGEISGVDYNFVSIQEFFSLEESGALLESGKFKGNYYGTPRPVHISAESPPITYQEHRNLLRNFRTRSKSLSNLEKSAEDAENSEDDSGLSGGSAGLSSSVPPPHRPAGRPRASSSGGESRGFESGMIGRRLRGVTPDLWEQAFSDPGDSYYSDRHTKRTNWQSPRAPSRESVYQNEWFTDQPLELRGFPVHALLTKGSRGFGFNIVGGSRPREFLQIYSVTSSGPSVLQTADILVFISGVCVLGFSHKEAVELLQAVPSGHSVDVEVTRGYPMLYTPDGCPKLPPPRLLDPPPTTTQPKPRLPTPTPTHHQLHFNYSYTEPGGVDLDANGNTMSFSSRAPPSYRRSSMSNAASPPSTRPPRHLRSLTRLQAFDPTLASQSDSEVVSAIGSHRSSMIRNHNNNSLSAPQPPPRYGFKSSESDLSSGNMSTSRLPLPLSPHRASSSPHRASSSPHRASSSPHRASSSLHSTSPHLFRPQSSHLRPPVTPEHQNYKQNQQNHHQNHRGANGFSPLSSPGGVSVGSLSGGELVPVALSQTEGDQGLGFSVTAGGPGGRMSLVRRVWDRKQCGALQPGDAIVKINGADVQSLSFSQVQTILQEHTKQAEVILLVYRGGIYHSSVSPGSLRRLPPPLLRPPPPPVSSDSSHFLPDSLPVPRTSHAPPPSPAPHLHSSCLVQSTSFLESIPVTLTMEPRDWINTGLEDEAGAVPTQDLGLERGGKTRPLRGFDVELRRKPGEGFGFVIASQDVENGKAASLLPHRFVTVRRGSPAAKSGQIRPGDHLEALEGRSVVTLPHRELAQILRRAGNSLRLTIVPRPSTYSSSVSETTEYDPAHRSKKGQRSRPKRDSRYYSVDLDRGSSGFGFSLRGGSEYNMGLYVLGLMEGGPASRSTRMQVSDQLVEINGDSTLGMTHSQAVEQIRRGGHRIHLILKRGNGYVPDYGREHGISPPSPLRHPQQQGVAAVNSSRRKRASSRHKKKPRSKSTSALEKEKARKSSSRRRRRTHNSEGELQSPESEPGEDRRRTNKESQSVTRDDLRNRDDSDERRERKRERGRSKSRRRKSTSEEKVEGEEQEEEGKVEEKVSSEEEDDVFLPIPSLDRKLPTPKYTWEEKGEASRSAEYRGLKREEEEEEEEDAERDAMPEMDPVFQRNVFSFLSSSLTLDQQQEEDEEEEESESGGSLSDAASISGLSLAAAQPGPWLVPRGKRRGGQRSSFFNFFNRKKSVEQQQLDEPSG
ncbi:LOW QUALITY PROTEIN: membrane-associated guanylate kinase, WW and PDZ domain-containing protein 1 [Gymnodraco acuticeps]|uniref:LOW QUALITY PROTEIN: membrane-associated guanylate kinase, WW and PDZ domain-containing protein 1 n=1 Tax=Gymnodraco acuticeps TaxID=8218 RepID=A0A6P8WDA2_GYMAC|nr:LOW QUALITY PROTEIN: membrane-associated guanylate kinase, WW and PDZ domain-containing protein 1 [Gymnodraco acuticeps]